MLKIISVFYIVLFTSIAFSQPPPPPAAAPKNGETPKKPFWDSVKDLPSKQPFTSLDGRFSISFNKQIQGFAGLNPKQLGFQGSGMQFTWKFQEGDAVLSFIDYPETDLKGTETELKDISTKEKETVLAWFSQSKVIDEKSFKSGAMPVIQTTYDLKNNSYGLSRLFVVKNRLYKIFVLYQNTENLPFFINALDTFKIISQSDIDAILKKKFEEMKPPPLPQEPVAAKEKSDAQDENLKGKVRKIVQESEDLSEGESSNGRKMSSVTYFNEKGNYVEREAYDWQGNPFQITAYGYLDGKRVSNSKMTSYEYNPPPAAPAPKSKTEEPPQKANPNYEYGFEYKYKDGKMIEKQLFYNNGKKGMRYVYNYSENQIERLVYTQEGELNQKYLITLNKNGDEIEEINYGLKNYKYYGDRKYRYEYEYDDKGNWLKRFMLIEVSENGATTYKRASVTYRTITYF
ncbi:MAG TPA: hypothetical protein PKY59_19410 [Pyrinomonadaceae bacterium]|nr:hypothetical protein [Pyrinomonadaceae bacterium]